MANYANAKSTIAANIYTNHLGQVTAEMVKTAANSIVDTLIAGGYLYAGVAKLTPTQTNPGTPDANVFYIATEPGTYTNFVGADGSLVVADGEVAIFKYNGSWSKEVTGAATAAQVTELGQETDIRFGDTGLFILYQGTYVPAQGKYNTASNRVITSFLPNKGTVKVKSGFKTMKYDVFDKFGVYVSTVNVNESGEYSWETDAGEYIKLTFHKSDNSDITPATDIVDYIKTGLTERLSVVEGKVDASILYSDSNQLNSLVKELYVPSVIAAYSSITRIRFFKAYVDDNEYLSGLGIYVNNAYIQFYKRFSTQAEALAHCGNIEYEKNGNSIYAVVDWDNIETGALLTILTTPKNIVNNVEFSPRIKEYIDQKSCVTDSDITIERVSDNIANPAYIQDGKFINNSGLISTNASWSMIGIPVNEGDVITAGGFDLKRSGYYAFYNGATKVSYGSFTNPAGTTNPLTLIVPSGCDTLYIDIKSDETGSNYDSLMINYGSTLKDYDEYKEAITKINNTELAGSGGGESSDLGTLIVDLPVSDGSGIASGYAYIDSTDRCVKVKA